MRRLALLLPVLLLAACSDDVSTYTPPETPPAVEQPATVDMQEHVLVDQDFTAALSKHGIEWLHAIGTKRIRGDVSQGTLKVELSRGESDTGWSAVGMYLAEVTTSKNGNAYPDESKYGTRLHFLASEWRGDCARHLAPSSSFGVLEEHSNTLELPLTAVTMTKGDDGCDTGMDTVNLAEAISDGGVFIGLMPSDTGYHLKATVTCPVGACTVDPL